MKRGPLPSIRALARARFVAFDADVVAGAYPIKNYDWSKAARSVLPGGSTAQLHRLPMQCSPVAVQSVQAWPRSPHAVSLVPEWHVPP